MPILVPILSAISFIIFQSSLASPVKSTAFLTLITLLSLFTNVPSFSAQVDAGRITGVYGGR